MKKKMSEAAKAPSVFETRRDQVFPALSDADIQRMRRFGEIRHYRAGDLVVRAGQPTEGLMLVLQGHIRVMAPEKPGAAMVIHGPGGIHGELAQLSGRPALV